MTTPTEVLARVARVLDELGIPYHVGGSVASAWYGTPRTTADVDIVIEADRSLLDALARKLEGEFYVGREAMDEALEHRSAFNAVSLQSPIKIDFFIVGTREFDREEFRRAIAHPLQPGDDLEVRFKSPEDLVLRKLEWYRLGGEISDQQWRDVQGILIQMRGRLDERYLDRWAAELGLSDLLSRARREAAEL